MKLTLKQARLLSELTQQEVATALGVHVQTYMKWERDPEEVSVRKAKQLSKLMKIDIDDIFFDAESNLIRLTEVNNGIGEEAIS